LKIADKIRVKRTNDVIEISGYDSNIASDISTSIVFPLAISSTTVPLIFIFISIKLFLMITGIWLLLATICFCIIFFKSPFKITITSNNVYTQKNIWRRKVEFKFSLNRLYYMDDSSTKIYVYNLLNMPQPDSFVYMSSSDHPSMDDEFGIRFNDDTGKSITLGSLTTASVLFDIIKTEVEKRTLI
jgi:hypothetical protein